MKHRIICFLSVLWWMFPGAAQTSKDGSIETPGSHMEKIVNGVYAIIHDHPTDQWPTSNTGVIIGDKYVLVVDGNYLPSISETDIGLIRQVTNKPVRYLVYTHWHMDHNNGGIAYKKAFPGLQIISQRMTAEYIAINSPWYAKRETAMNSAKRLSLQQLENEFHAGKDTAGKLFTQDELKSRDTVIRQRKNELAEFETLEVVKPDRVFESTLTIDMGGGRQVLIQDWIRGNSPHDATIYLPKEKILFAGDLVVQLPLPFTGESWPVSWATVMKNLERIPVTKLVPGHGPVLNNNSYVKQLRELFEESILQVKNLLAKGTPVDKIAAQVNMDHLRKGVWAVTGTEADADWKITINTLIERTIKCVRGQGGLGE